MCDIFFCFKNYKWIYIFINDVNFYRKCFYYYCFNIVVWVNCLYFFWIWYSDICNWFCNMCVKRCWIIMWFFYVMILNWFVFYIVFEVLVFFKRNNFEYMFWIMNICFFFNMYVKVLFNKMFFFIFNFIFFNEVIDFNEDNFKCCFC